MSKCGVCMANVKPNQLSLKCLDEGCGKEFHAACVNMSKADIDGITAGNFTWRCPPCAKARRQSMRFDSKANEEGLSLEDIMQKMEELVRNNKDLEKSVNASYESLNEKIEENTKASREQTDKLDRCLKTIEDLAAENKRLKDKVCNLEARLEDVEQYSRVNMVEIHGVPQEKNEDVVAVVKEVGKALDMEISDSMIDACHRMGKRLGPGSPPPGIIVKFVRRLDKEELLKKRRVKRNFSTRHMNLGTDSPVYINEALSPARRRLYAAARQIQKEKNLRFLWVRGGKILLRKEEAAPVIQVTCQADLDRI